jgi:predicted HTH transcriptional regulator
MNTDGGTLYVGVSDTGELLGIQEDHFPSEDKFLLHFGNLFNDKIGRQFTKNMNYQVVEVEGVQLLRVICSRSAEPVFLKEGERRDEFYVRHGPSSVELSMSEFMDYSKDRFKR